MANFFSPWRGKDGGWAFDEILQWLFGLLIWFRGGQQVKEGDGEDGKIISVLRAFFSRADEGVWLSLIAELEGHERDALTLVLKKLNGIGEEAAFRLTVVNAPVPTKVIEISDPKDKDGKNKIKKIVKEEFSASDPRIKFLQNLAALVNANDEKNKNANNVVRMLRTHKLANENEIAKHALAFWNGTLAWMNGRVCKFFGVNDLKEITFAKVVSVMDAHAGTAARYVNVLTRKVPRRPVADMNIGFWRDTMTHHPAQGWLIIIGTILAIAFFAFA